MPNPASMKSGYELRFTEVTSGSYEATLSLWQAGTQTVLASQSGVTLPAGSRFALVSKAGVVSALKAEGSGAFTSFLSATNATFNSGYIGVEGSGNITKITNLRCGPLPSFEK